MSEVLYDKDAHVVTLTLNRPERMNAISGAMLESLSSYLIEADADPDARVVLLTGAGRGFCAGLDLKDLAAGGTANVTAPAVLAGTPRYISPAAIASS